MGPYQVLPLRARVDLGAMAMKRYSAFPQSSGIIENSPSDSLVSYPEHSWVSYPSAEKQSMYSTEIFFLYQLSWVFLWTCKNMAQIMIVTDLTWKGNGMTLARWSYHWHLPKFTCTTLVTVWNAGGISGVPCNKTGIITLFFFRIHLHHHVVPLARISLTLSRHFSLSFIASGRSSGLHPVSSHSCCMYVRAGLPAFAWPYAGVHRSTSLMSSSLLLEQCPACLVRLTCIVFVMGGRWSYSWCLVGCYRQDLFNIALNILA